MKTRTPRRGLPAQAALLTSRTAALLGVSGRTLLKLVDDGLVAPIGRVGLGYVFDEDQVAELRRQLDQKARQAYGGKHERPGGQPAR